MKIRIIILVIKLFYFGFLFIIYLGHGSWMCYVQCTLVTVATILGTGILGLPTTLAYSGLTPFIVTFVVNYFVQVFIVILFTELMVLCRNDETMEYVELPMDSYGTVYQNIREDGVNTIDNPCKCSK